MDELDSRALRYTDCYAQKFSEQGTVRYHLLPAGAFVPPSTDEGFAIEVTEAKRPEPEQHYVTVRREQGRLVPDKKSLSIAAGDVVMWNTDQASLPPYSVCGVGPSGPFGSAALSNGGLYTHAFGTPGRYHWTNPHATGMGGTIDVRPVDEKMACEGSLWSDALENGSVIVITGQTVTPDRLSILMGQTVFWVVEDGRDISIVLDQPALRQ